jgi:hypothetical protein
MLETKINIKVVYVFDVRKWNFKTNWFIIEIKGPTSKGLINATRFFITKIEKNIKIINIIEIYK